MLAVIPGDRGQDPERPGGNALASVHLAGPIPLLVLGGNIMPKTTGAGLLGPLGRHLETLPVLLYGSGLRIFELVTLPLAAVMRGTQALMVRGKGKGTAGAPEQAGKARGRPLAGAPFAR